MAGMRHAMVVLAALTAATSMAASTREERHVVKPGDGMGGISLGMTVPQVHDAMTEAKAKPLLTGKDGGPAAWMDDKAGAAIEAYQVDPMGKDRYVGTLKVFYVKNRVAQIATDNPLFATPKGANIRMTSTEFRSLHSSVHPLAQTNTWGGAVRPYDSDRLGLSVTYMVDRDGTESRTGQEIFVHSPDAPLLLESPRHAGGAAQTGVSSGQGTTPGAG